MIGKQNGTKTQTLEKYIAWDGIKINLRDIQLSEVYYTEKLFKLRKSNKSYISQRQVFKVLYKREILNITEYWIYYLKQVIEK